MKKLLILFVLSAFLFSCGNRSRLNDDSYEIIATEHIPGIEQYHIFYKGKNKSEKSLKQFIQQFREEKTAGDANISLYDDNSITHLATKFPLEPAEYLVIADHFIAISGFSAPDEILLYPYQNDTYKELGGSNWQVKPID